MNPVDPGIIEAAGDLWSQLSLFGRTMLLPWRLAQLGMIGVLALIAHLAASQLSPGFRRWLRTRTGWPKWRLRAGILIDQRLRGILFAVIAWALVVLMQQLTWPSRSQLIALAAMLATAWVAIGFLARLIRNRVLRRIVTWGSWVWVTLLLLGFLDPARRFLDSLALSLGDFRLSALTALNTVFIGILLIAGARALSRLTASWLASNTDVTPAMRVLLGKFVQATLIVLAFAIALKVIGLDLTGLAFFTGALGIGLGFGLQKVVSNLMSGVIILLDKSIKPGDVISLGGNLGAGTETFGWIDSLGARYVSVVTRDGKEYLIPNEDLVTSQVVNWSHTNDFVRLDLVFRASYSDDPHMVSKTAINAAMTVKRVLPHRTPVCWVTEFGDSSVDYVLRFWISDPEGGITNVRGQVFLALWDAFKEKGIRIPYPQRELRLLPGETAPAKATLLPADPPFS